MVEGVDVNSLDFYNPNDVNQRAVVSGHELGHIYGEQNHPDSGFCSGKHHIMKNGIHKMDARLCFMPSSQTQIKNRYFAGVS